MGVFGPQSSLYQKKFVIDIKLFEEARNLNNLRVELNFDNYLTKSFTERIQAGYTDITLLTYALALQNCLKVRLCIHQRNLSYIKVW